MEDLKLKARLVRTFFRWCYNDIVHNYLDCKDKYEIDKKYRMIRKVTDKW